MPLARGASECESNCSAFFRSCLVFDTNLLFLGTVTRNPTEPRTNRIETAFVSAQSTPEQREHLGLILALETVLLVKELLPKLL